MDLVSEDSSARKKGIAFLQDLSQAMKYMGGTIMAGINYSSWPRKLMPGEDKELLTSRAVEGVREAIKTAEDCNVLFCLEVVNRFEQFMMNTAAEGIAFAKRVGSPNCKILLDTFHMNIEEDSLRGSLLESKDWLGHFHIGEPNRRPPGADDPLAGNLRSAARNRVPRARLSWSPSLFQGGTSAGTFRSIVIFLAVMIWTIWLPSR